MTRNNSGAYDPDALPEIPAIDPREAKLPGWTIAMLAKHRIIMDQLVGQVEKARADARIALLATNPLTADIVVEPYGRTPVGLPSGSKIEFRTGGEYFHVLMDHGKLDITGSRPVLVDPMVSNHIQLHMPPGGASRAHYMHAPKQ